MSLNFKMSIVIVVTLAITFVTYVAAAWIENKVTENNYKSSEAVEKNVGAAYDELTQFVSENHIKGTDSDSMQKWIRDHDYTYLYIYDNYKSAFDGGWRVDSKDKKGIYGVTPGEQRKAIEKKTDPGEKIEVEDPAERITPDAFKVDVQNRIVDFADGPYYVYIDVYKEEHWHQIMAVVKILLCAATFITILLVYNGKVMRRIINLSTEVHKIADGDLEAPITPKSNDEIGRLAESVDNMRDSILEKLQNEKKAWDANTQLITAMSHDIRTPLTSLIGYLDIIGGKKYRSEEELMKYIDTSRDKAFQLKELSDKLFQYFLVFGSEQSEKVYEIYDAGILIQQLLSEHSVELISYGFNVKFDYAVEDAEIKVDLSGIRRLFDNLFSNIMKYGDKKYNVTIKASIENGKIVIRLLNSVLESSRKVESNKIGLKTCEKICDDMGAELFYEDQEKLYKTKITIPIYVRTADDPPKDDEE